MTTTQKLIKTSRYYQPKFIDVNILEEIVSAKWLDISDLQKLSPEDFDRCNSSFNFTAQHKAVQVAGLRQHVDPKSESRFELSQNWFTMA